MRVGYARTSTVEQVAGLEAQERELRASGVEKFFSERVSSVAKREKLEAALDFSAVDVWQSARQDLSRCCRKGRQEVVRHNHDCQENNSATMDAAS